MFEYLKDATDFTDMTMKLMPSERGTIAHMPYDGGQWILCPLCRGYGGWNIKLNAYPNNPKYKHFRASCRQCNGWGWVSDKSTDATCIHDYKEIASSRMFEHNYQCSKCNAKHSVDSSG